MAEFLIKPVADKLISQVASLVAAEINLAIDVKRQISKLGKTVTMIQALLNDAERRQVRDQSVKLWLKELEDIAYEAEDVLDDVEYEVLRRKVKIQNKLNKKVSNFLSSSNPILFRLKIAHKIKEINLSLDDIKNQAIGLGLRELYAAAAAPLVRQSCETHSFVGDSKVVGRKDEILEIVNMLTAVSSNQEEALSVIPIVGMAGLGKTTFAKCICNTEQVKMSFGLRMWVSVSEDFDVKRILKEMLEYIDKRKCDMENLNTIIHTLREKVKKLEGGKYLLVLDDVWNEDPEKWESLKDSLEAINPNTRNHIIVTTRKDRVAAIMGTMPRFHLERLSDELCWSIFEQRAFAKGGAVRTEGLVSIGKQIVKKCSGLPLAAAASGGMMRTKQNIQEWLSILDSSVWNVWDESGILPALKLSFDHLPCAALKQCFAYCSIFPKDFDIKKDCLIQLWMGQGLLQPQPGSSLEMEDIGDAYFHTLLWNNLLQDVRMDDYGNIRECKMHDVVHDLAQSLSTSGHLAVEASKRDNNMPVYRHLSLISSSETLSNEIKLDCQKLRTLFLEDCPNVGSLVKFKRLRGLVLRYCEAQEFPTSIGILKHLTYLDFSKSNIKTPYSVTDLFKLQTLRLSDQSFERGVAKDFKKLASLRHFYIEDTSWTRSQMPAEIGQLSQLQTVPFFVVGQDKGHGIEELGCLCNLRGTLKLYDLQHVRGREQAKKANLMGKGKIIELKFCWSRVRDGETKNDQDVLEGLQPHHNLKALTIELYTGESFPSWMIMGGGMSTFQNLVEIQFVDCDGVEEIPTLGRLPSLKKIKMCGMKGIKCIGHEFYGSSGSNDGATNSTTTSSSSNDSQITLFPALKELSLERMGSLEEWSEVELPSGGLVFPVLEKLRIIYCPQLRNIPSQFPSLKSLLVADVGNLSWQALSNTSSKLSSLTCLRVRELGPSFPLEELMEKNGQSLRHLLIQDCQELTRLPDALASLTSLEELEIYRCRNLTCIPDRRSLTSLRWLAIGGFGEELESFPCLNDADDIQQLTSLQRLTLYGWPKLKTLPDTIQHLPALKYLHNFCFDGLVELPDWLGNLSSLLLLHLWGCKNLKFLPDAAAMQRLSNLKRLTIEDCSRLKEAISNRSGPEWSKIAHIPEVVVDGLKL